MDTVIRIGVTIVVGYGLAVAAIYLLQRKLMYFPYGPLAPPAEVGLGDMREVAIETADGLRLVAWHRPPTQEGAPTVVLFHGNAGNIAGRAFKARLFLDAGYGLLLVEYRGFGGNPGAPDEAGLYEDGRAALDFLSGEGVAGASLVLYGESLGSGVAVQMASEREVGALVLEAPFTSADDVGAAAYPFLPVRLLIKDHFASVEKIGAVAAPLLIVHGERDRTVPVALGKRLLAAANEPKEGLFIPQANHMTLYDYGAGAAVLDFLARRFPD